GRGRGIGESGVEAVREGVSLAAGGGRGGGGPLCGPAAAARPRRCTTTVVIPGFRRLAGGLWSDCLTQTLARRSCAETAERAARGRCGMCPTRGWAGAICPRPRRRA